MSARDHTYDERLQYQIQVSTGLDLRMKLTEITIPMDPESGPFDDMVSRDQEDAMQAPKDTVHKDKEKLRDTPKSNSNIKKARRIRNLVQIKKRETNPESDETHHTSHMGGHGSAFLHR